MRASAAEGKGAHSQAFSPSEGGQYDLQLLLRQAASEHVLKRHLSKFSRGFSIGGKTGSFSSGSAVRGKASTFSSGYFGIKSLRQAVGRSSTRRASRASAPIIICSRVCRQSESVGRVSLIGSHASTIPSGIEGASLMARTPLYQSFH